MLLGFGLGPVPNRPPWGLFHRTVISNLRYAYPQGYEPGHLGVGEKKLNNVGKIPLLGYLFNVTTYKFEITATILIIHILLI
jgi:hypothetical protein